MPIWPWCLVGSYFPHFRQDFELDLKLLHKCDLWICRSNPCCMWSGLFGWEASAPASTAAASTTWCKVSSEYVVLSWGTSNLIAQALGRWIRGGSGHIQLVIVNHTKIVISSFEIGVYTISKVLYNGGRAKVIQVQRKDLHFCFLSE